MAAPAPASVAVTAPVNGANWVNGNLQSVSWTVGAPVSNGSFFVMLLDPVTFNYYVFDAASPAVPAQTIYTDNQILSGVPPGAYKVRVWYVDSVGTFMLYGDQAGTVERTVGTRSQPASTELP